MRRRSFLVCLGAAMAGPAGARAQPAKVPTIGVLVPANPEPFRSVFREALRGLGYVEKQSIRVEFRSAEGNPGHLDPLAAELVGLKIDVLVAWQTPAITAARQAAGAIPIVMAGSGDPVATGFVASLARPGGNITGTTGATAQVSVKTIELIREMMPLARRVAVLANSADPFTKPYLEHLQQAARTLGMELRPVPVRDAEEFDSAFAAMTRERVDAVVVQPSLPRRPAIDLAFKHRLPSLSQNVHFVAQGGLASYAADQEEMWRKGAAYVDKILKGAKPADLPVEQPTKFNLVINPKTAKAIGVDIPRTVLDRADEVIE
jgi:putative ABC transport system substrate-binding protein